MQTILLGRPIGGPRRVSGGTRGARGASRAAQSRSASQTAAAEERLIVVLAERRRVDALAVVELQPRPLLARLAESNQLHATSTPPSIGYAWPVTNAASSEQRYSARCATSSAVPMRPIG